jgi:hypothetical protein
MTRYCVRNSIAENIFQYEFLSNFFRYANLINYREKNLRYCHVNKACLATIVLDLPLNSGGEA